MGSVSRTVAEREASPAKPTPTQVIKAEVERYRPVIRRALPEHVSEDRFVSTILTAVRNEPKLLACDPTSVLAAAIKAAQLGLEPNDGRGLCAIIPYGREAQYQTMYKGAIELARRSGAVRRVVARTVYENDVFDFEYGTAEEGLKHKPATEDRGKAVFWYAIAWAPDGTLMDFVVLTREDIEYHRSFSKQKDGQMWGKSYDAAARKTAVWELMKLLPQSPELAASLTADERTFRIEAEGVEAEADPEPTHIGEARQVDRVAIDAQSDDASVDPDDVPPPQDETP